MDHCNGTGATTPGAKTFLSDNTGIYSVLWRVFVFQELRIEPNETDEFSHCFPFEIESHFYFPVSSEEVTGKQSRSVNLLSFPPNESLSSARGVASVASVPSPGHGAMVTSPPHLATWGPLQWPLLTCAWGTGWGPEIALQPFNKSCPSSEYINFSLSRGGVTCHHCLPWKPVKDVFSPLGN